MTQEWHLLRDEVADVVRRVAHEVIVPGQVDATLVSGDGEAVTDIDLEAEGLLRAALVGLVPAKVVGEEAAKADPALVGVLDTTDPVWLVDPVDGTAAYAAGGRAYGTIVALVVDGETRGGWLWSRHDDAVYAAIRGEGATRDDTALTPPADRAERGQLLDRYMSPALAAAARAALATVTLVSSSNCAAVDYPSIVEGRLDFSVYGRARPWDHAAGALLVEELGGAARCLDGRPYRPRRRDAGVVVVGDEVTRRAVADPLLAALASA